MKLIAVNISGEVVEGYDVVKAIEKKGSGNGKPSAKIVIAQSGTI